MSNRNKGILAILCSALGFSLMNLLIPMAGDLPTVQKSFFRNIIALSVAAIILYQNHQKQPIKEFVNPKSVPWWTLIARALVGTIGIWCNFYAVDHLLIADASVLNKLSPFAILVFSHLFLKEKLQKLHFIILGIAFLGVLLVVKPTLGSTDLFPYFIGILGGISAGAAYTLVRQLSNLGVTPAFIVFFFSGFSCLMSLPQLLTNFHPMTLVNLLVLLGVGLMAAVGQFGITLAYKFAPASEISVYDYSSIIFTGIWGLLFLGQVPDGLSLVGYLLIVGAGILSFYYNRFFVKK